MKYIVYLTINLVNSKVYIGMHKTKDSSHFDGYLGNGTWSNRPSTYMRPKTAFQFAVKKYGIKNFKRITLYTFDTIEEAITKLNELVTESFILQSNNYNIIEYRDYKEIPIYQFSLEGEFLKKWDSISDAVNFFHSIRNAFIDSIQLKEELFNSYWSTESDINVNEYTSRGSRAYIYKYDGETGKCLQIYSSIKEASESENIDIKKLYSDISFNAMTNNKYYFSYTLYDEFIPSPKKFLNHRKFYVYTLSGEFIQTFETGKELFKFLDMHSWNKLYNFIQNKNGIYKDYQIKLEFCGDKIEPGVIPTTARKVAIYTITGEYIKTCDSISQAAREFDSHVSSINRVLRGLANTANNHIFRLVN